MDSTQNQNQTPGEPKKKIDYTKILRRAYDITLNNKFLWIYGALIALGSGGGNFNGGGGSGKGTEHDQKIADSVANFFTNHWVAIGIAIGLFLLFLIAIWVLGIISRGALIDSVNKIDAGTATDFKTGFKRGVHYFWRVLGIGLIFFLLILVIIAVIAMPIIYLVVLEKFAPAIFIGIMGLLFFIPIVIFLGLISQLSVLFGVILDRPVFAAISEAHGLLIKNMSAIGLLWLITIGVSIIASTAMVIAALPLLLMAVPFVLGIYAAFQTTGLIVSIAISLLILMIAFAAVRGVFEVYLQTVWFLGFKELMGEKIKTEEEHKVEHEAAVHPLSA